MNVKSYLMELLKFVYRIASIVAPGFTRKINNLRLQLLSRREQRFVRKFVRAQKLSSNGKRILFWRSTSTGSMVLELILATALKLRGYDVIFVLCDGVQSACIRRWHKDNIPLKDWKKSCSFCLSYGVNQCRQFDIDFILMSALVPTMKQNELRIISKTIDIDKVFSINHCNIIAGHYLEGALKRFFKGASYNKYDQEEYIREFLYGFLASAEATEKVIIQYQPDYIFSSHCMYTDFGPILTAAKNHNIPLTTFSMSYLKFHYFFGRIEFGGNRHIRVLSPELWEEIERSPFTRQHEKELENYLSDRYRHGKAADMRFFPEFSNLSREDLKKKLSINNDNPIWCLYTHLNWDDLFDYTDLLFDFNEWVIETIKIFLNITDVNLLIKIHPYEYYDRQEYGVSRYVKERFHSLPEHIGIIPPDSDVNPLTFLHLVDGCITMSGTSGIEFAILGKPVILAGKPYYGGLGFTYDAHSVEEYKALLRSTRNLGRLTEEETLLAKKYAYTLFIRQQIPINVGQESDFDPIDYNKLGNLLPGNDKAMDMICDRIMDGGEFMV